MKAPYELRVIADGLAEWQKSGGPAVDCMKYAETVLREIADEFEAEIAKLAESVEQVPAQVDPTQASVPASDTPPAAPSTSAIAEPSPASSPSPSTQTEQSSSSTPVSTSTSDVPTSEPAPAPAASATVAAEPSAEEQAAALNIPPATPAS